MRRVTLVNTWHDDNKGDSAIVIGTLGVLRDVLGETAHFGLVAQNISSEQELPYAYRHVQTAAGAVEIAPCLLPTMKVGRTRWGLYFAAAVYLCRFLAASLTLKYQRTPSARIIAESGLVISKGGHKLHAVKANPLHLANLCSHLAPLVLARRYGVPFVLWGHSLGPFNNLLSRWLTHAVLKDAYQIGVRESLSYKQALQLKLPPDKVIQIPDPAFMLMPTLTKRVEQLMEQHALVPGEFLVLTVRQRGHPQHEVYQHYLKGMAALVQGLLRAGFAQRAAIVVHAQGPIPIENDAMPSKQLLELLPGLPVCLIQEDFTPMELCALYGQSKLMIGTRFHSVILAMAGGAPACAVSYFGPKSFGIMRDMGLEQWVTSMEQLVPDQLQQQILAADLHSLRQHIQQQVQHARESFQTATRQLLNNFVSRGV